MESTLSTTFNDLSGDLGQWLGYGRGALNGDPAWDTLQQANVTRCVKGGLRNVYFCGFEWSFLKPVATLTLLNGQFIVALPDDYSACEGRMSLASTTAGTAWMPLEFGLIGKIYEQHNLYPLTTGRPVMVAEEPIKGTGPTQGQRFQLRFWPIADGDYTLQFQYYLLPDYLDGSKPYVYGGAQHSETFLLAAKAVAERDLDDLLDGPQQIAFMRQLEVSKEMDRRNKPQVLGYNGDRSDMNHREYGRNWQHWEYPAPVTYGGVLSS